MAIFAKQAYGEGIGVTALLAARFVLAAAVFWAIVGMRRAVRSIPAVPTPRATIGTALALGAIGYSVQSACFFSALRHIDASLTSLLLYTYPALVCCGAVALGREHVTPWKAMALALATAGTALVLLGGGSGGLQATGVLFGLGAAVTYAAYILVADGLVARIDPWLMSALVATGAAVTFVAAGAVTGALEPPSGAAWIWIAAIAAAVDGRPAQRAAGRLAARRRADRVDRLDRGAGRHRLARDRHVRRGLRPGAGARRGARARGGPGAAVATRRRGR